MAEAIIQQFVNRAVAMGPMILMQGVHLERPTDVVEAPSLSIDDKRAILAAWASDLYAVESKPALRHLPGTDPIPIDEVQSALIELDQRCRP